MSVVQLPDGSRVTVRTAADLAYVIQGDDEGRSVKIGRSRTPERRVAGLTSGVPFKARLVAILDNGSQREREMKAALADYRLQGEWYRPSTALDEYIAAARKQNGLLLKRRFDAAFFEEFIQPGILEYLNGRTPGLTWGGDFIFRLLHVGFSGIGDRTSQLLINCPNAFTPELIAGYVPISIDAVTPRTMPEPTGAAA